MIRINKMTDYATVILAAMAHAPTVLHSSAVLSAETKISPPTVSKLLQILQRAGLVQATRGLRGGYQLARPAIAISAAAILDALEGPVAVTDCSIGEGHCNIETTCGVGRAWQRVNIAIRRSLYDVSLAQLAGLNSPALQVGFLEQEIKPMAGGRAASAMQTNINNIVIKGALRP